MDIRSFFGGSPPSKKASPAKATNGSNADKEKDEEMLLVDSDEEDAPVKKAQSNPRKRLVSKDAPKTSGLPSNAQVQDLTGSSGSSKTEAIILGDTPPEDGKGEKVKAASSPGPASKKVRQENDKLPALSPNATKKDGVARGITGEVSSVAGFFGEKATDPPASSTSKKQKTSTTTSTSNSSSTTSVAQDKEESSKRKKSPVKSQSPSVKKSPAKSKSAPAAQPTGTVNYGIFGGKKMCVSGSFEESVGREAIEDLVKEHGAQVMSAVSGRTDYLIIGEVLENNKPPEEGNKYKTAVEKNVKILKEAELREMIDAELKKGGSHDKPVTKLGNDWAKSFGESGGSSSSSSRSGNKTGSSSAQSHPGSRIESGIMPSSDDQMWVDKYKPGGNAQLIGNQSEFKNLMNWLQNWEAYHLKKTKKVPFSKENPGAKAVLLSGPPGIGKSTLAALVAKQIGYEVLELNASDTRSKKSVNEELGAVVLSQAMSSTGQLKKRLVIMDEVDGMGGSDRGGIPELIKIIKAAKSPIICICNDRQAQKIRSLVNHCYDMRVKRPTKQQIAQRLVEIATKEGMTVDFNAAVMLVEQGGNDIRQAVHALQMWRAQSKTMKYEDLKNSMSRIGKDQVLRQSAFDSCGILLSGSKKHSLDERYQSFFVDYSLIPLLLQQNYVECSRNGIFKDPTLNDADKMKKLAKASIAVSDMDLVGNQIMGIDQHWELLPPTAMLACRVGSLVEGFQGFPTFPQWLGKYATTNKSKRLTNELVTHSLKQIGQGFNGVRMDYVPYCREHLMNILLPPDNAEVPNEVKVSRVIGFLDSYGFSRDDFMENMKDLQLKLPKAKITNDMVNKDQVTDRYEKLDTKLKTALTRVYNQGSHSSQALVAQQAAKGKKGKAVPLSDDITATTEDLEAAKAVDDDGEEEVDMNAFAAKKSKAKKPAAKKTKAKK